MRRYIFSISFILLITTLLAGCSTYTEHPKARQQAVRDVPTSESPENVLVKEISGGKLVEVYDEYVKLKYGQSKENWMIIRNARDKDETFTVYPCQACIFEQSVFNIPKGEYKIIKFKVTSKEGQQDIRVKDSRNNAYGHARISVIVE